MMQPRFSTPPIAKNAFEEVHVDLSEYNGHDLVSLRVFYDKTGEMLPGKQGLALRVSAIPELIDRLQLAHAEAVRLGLVTEEGPRN